MDRSYLSRPEVVEASRQFVCVRLATYEDADEAALLKSLAHTKSGELENSVFAILSPDGKQKLVRAGRSMRGAYGDAAQMAAGMKTIASRFIPNDGPRTLPLVANVRLALDVAAADNQPLVVLAAQNEAARKDLEEKIARLAWQPEHVGRFVYAATTDPSELTIITRTSSPTGIFVVEPNAFGTEGKLLKQVEATAAEAALSQALQSSLDLFVRHDKTMRDHVRQGKQQGILWQTKLPVTDPEERNARERGRKPPGK